MVQDVVTLVHKLLRGCGPVGLVRHRVIEQDRDLLRLVGQGLLLLRILSELESQLCCDLRRISTVWWWVGGGPHAADGCSRSLLVLVYHVRHHAVGLTRELLVDCWIRGSGGMKRPVVLELQWGHSGKWRHLYYGSCKRTVARRKGVSSLDSLSGVGGVGGVDLVVVGMMVDVRKLLRTGLLLVKDSLLTSRRRALVTEG